MSELFEDHVVTVDRSTLERFAKCPMQARLEAEHKPVVGVAAVIGQEGHEAHSKTIQAYLDTGGNMTRHEVVEEYKGHLRTSRPDVQPALLDAFVPVAYAFAELLVSMNPLDIKHFDGGIGAESGQLAWDAPNGIRVTTEFDLLTASPYSPVVLVDHDWKGGRGLYTLTDVAESFQFQTHAVLALENYPDCQQLQVVVWNTRTGRPLPPVEFKRERLSSYRARVLTAVDAFCRWEHERIEQVPAWPSAEKCRICPVARHCPAADPDLKADPVQLVSQLCAMDAKRDSINEQLKAIVKRTGKEIVAPNGMRFGTEKPSKRRVLYQTYTDTPDQESEAE